MAKATAMINMTNKQTDEQQRANRQTDKQTTHTTDKQMHCEKQTKKAQQFPGAINDFANALLNRANTLIILKLIRINYKFSYSIKLLFKSFFVNLF